MIWLASAYDEHQRGRVADGLGWSAGGARALARRRLRRRQRAPVAAPAAAPLLPVALRRRAAPSPPRGSRSPPRRMYPEEQVERVEYECGNEYYVQHYFNLEVRRG